MPRQARLDAPGTLHHVMDRGISGAYKNKKYPYNKIFNNRLSYSSNMGNAYSVGGVPNIWISKLKCKK